VRREVVVVVGDGCGIALSRGRVLGSRVNEAGAMGM